MFFVFFMFWKEHDYSCSWYPTNPSKRESKTKTKSTNLRLNRSNPCEKKKKSKLINPSNPYKTKTKSNPSNGSTHQRIWNQNQIKPIKQINPSNANQTDQPIYQQNQIKPIKRTNPSNANQTNQPIYHCGSLKVEATTTMAVARGEEEGRACELQPWSYGEERENLRLERV